MPQPIVAIVGRVNVGKSTLFNRLVGSRQAIVADMPGTTRDRIYAPITWQGKSFTLVDTGGLEMQPSSPLLSKVKEQVKLAISEADLILFVVDGKEGLNPEDEEIAGLLRKSHKSVLLVVNKVDNLKREWTSPEFYKLGFKDLIPISAYHGLGVGELMSKILEILPPTYPAKEEELIKIAIVGRANVGKSCLLNAILGRERAIVEPTPGTTRDAIDSLIHFKDKPILLIDTAGLARPSKLMGIGFYSALRALRTIHRCDVALLVIDALEPFTSQDLHIAGYIFDSYKGIVVVINKWDLAPIKDKGAYIAELNRKAPFLPDSPIIFTSATLGWGVSEVLEKAIEVYNSWKRFIPAQELKNWLRETSALHPPPAKGPGHFNIYSVSQVQTGPPTFLFKVSDPKKVHFSYQRFLGNKLQETYKLKGVAPCLIFKR